MAADIPSFTTRRLHNNVERIYFKLTATRLVNDNGTAEFIATREKEISPL